MWQPIATAPRDGTAVLLCTEDRSLQIGWWSQSSGRWSYGGGVWGDNVELWQALPDVPAKRTR